MPENGHLLAMDESHIGAATEIMARGRDAMVGERANATFRKHFALQKLGLEDGRRYFVWIEDGRVAGLSAPLRLNEVLRATPVGVLREQVLHSDDSHGRA